MKLEQARAVIGEAAAAHLMQAFANFHDALVSADTTTVESSDAAAIAAAKGFIRDVTMVRKTSEAALLLVDQAYEDKPKPTRIETDEVFRARILREVSEASINWANIKEAEGARLDELGEAYGFERR